MIYSVINFTVISIGSKIIGYPKLSYINKIMLSYPLQHLIPNTIFFYVTSKKNDELMSMIMIMKGKYSFEIMRKPNNLT